jgi:Arc/MetJ family transcription regulator
MPEVAMTKRLIDIDDELLEQARAALGTDGISDTVRGGLREAIATAARREEIGWLRAGGLAEMADKPARERAWR